MGWNPIGTQGRFAALLATTLRMSIDELDELDGHKDGNLPSPTTLREHFLPRIATFSTTAGRSSVYGFVIDDGDGKIDGGDVVVLQIGDWKGGRGVNGENEFWYVGGRFSNLLRGYFETSEYLEDIRTVIHDSNNSDPPVPEKELPKKIWDEIQRRRLTKFSDFIPQVDNILTTVSTPQRGK